MNKEFLQNLSLIILRITLSIVFIPNGWRKLTGFEKTVTFLGDKLDFFWPTFFASLLAGFEFFGAMLVIVGLGTRLVSLGWCVIMVTAITLVHWSDGLSGNDFQLTLLAGSLVLLFQGAGFWSLDTWVEPWIKGVVYKKGNG